MLGVRAYRVLLRRQVWSVYGGVWGNPIHGDADAQWPDALHLKLHLYQLLSRQWLGVGSCDSQQRHMGYWRQHAALHPPEYARFQRSDFWNI